MNEHYDSSVFLIESQEDDNVAFGTSFVVYKEPPYTYLVTCAHVIDKIGSSKISVEGKKANIVTIGAADGLDLALLSTESTFHCKSVELADYGQPGDKVTIYGFRNYRKHRLIKPYHGNLGDKVALQQRLSQDRVDAWELKLYEGEIFHDGLSGSPVIHNDTNHVIGVVTFREGQGRKGLAISSALIEDLSTGFGVRIARIPSHVNHMYGDVINVQGVKPMNEQYVSDQTYLEEVYELVAKHFDKEELKTLCFSLGVEYDDLRGEGKVGKVRELVLKLNRHERITELKNEVIKRRAFISWPTMSQGLPPGGLQNRSDNAAIVRLQKQIQGRYKTLELLDRKIELLNQEKGRENRSTEILRIEAEIESAQQQRLDLEKELLELDQRREMLE